MTAREWFKNMQEPFGSAAIQNTCAHELAKEYSKMSEALIVAFSWYMTPEGHDYWDRYHKTLKKLLQ